MVGFLLGIIYCNLGGNAYLSSNGIFSEYFLSSFLPQSVISNGFLFYLALVRVVPIAVIFVLGYTGFHKASVVISLVWTGFSNGMLVSSAIIVMGMKGLFFYLSAMFPQLLFYVPAYFLVLIQSYRYKNQEWNLPKFVFAGLMIGMGVVSEALLNPYVIALVLK